MSCRQPLSIVIFDLDGTLIDSAPDLRVALNKLLAEEGRRALAVEEVALMVGDGAARLVERAFAATGDGAAAAGLAALTGRFLGFYAGHATELTRPYPGVRETLDRLRTERKVLAICTNKPEAPTREVLRDLSLEPYFAQVVGGDTVPGVRKPDPQMIFALLERLEADAGAAVMVGDSVNDVGVARAAAIPVIVCAGGYSRVPAAELGADLVIDDFADLPEALTRLC